MTTTFQSEHSPSPAKNPTQVADRLRIESSHSIKRCLPFAKKTGLKEPVTESIDEEQEPLAEPTIEEPPAKRVRNATSAVARKPAAKPTKKVVAKPVKQNASSKGSSLKERGKKTILRTVHSGATCRRLLGTHGRTRWSFLLHL